MDLLDHVDRMIDERHLLKHPFYTKWAEGTLPREALQEYARQYFAFESTFPRLLSAMHAREDRPEVRQRLLDNLWDEEHGDQNHAELWLRFAEGIGVARDDVQAATRNEATERLVDLYQEVTTTEPVAAGVAALYAYERQVPEVAPSKIEGLKRHFDVADERTLRFFVIHGVLDVEHAGAERDLLASIAEGHESEVSGAVDRATQAWWDFLSAVDMPAEARAAA
jgi:pyrroloquinoline-quinone synthase